MITEVIGAAESRRIALHWDIDVCLEMSWNVFYIVLNRLDTSWNCCRPQCLELSWTVLNCILYSLEQSWFVLMCHCTRNGDFLSAKVVFVVFFVLNPSWTVLIRLDMQCLEMSWTVLKHLETSLNVLMRFRVRVVENWVLNRLDTSWYAMSWNDLNCLEASWNVFKRLDAFQS